MLLMLLVIDCTQSPVASGDNGSGTGVGNGAVIVGKLIGPDSLPIANALVRLRPDMYVADTSGKVNYLKNDTLSTVHSDSSGVFVIDSICRNRTYYVEALSMNASHLDSGTLYKVDVPKDSLADTVLLPTRIIEPVKVLNGTIVIDSLPQNAYVQIYGMERIGRTDSNGKFIIQELPVGECERNECEYKLKITVVGNDGKTTVYDNSELEIRFDNNNNIISQEFELINNDND